MTFHLVGPHLTTTNYKKREQKITKVQRAELESGWRDRNQRLKSMGLPKESFEQYLDFVNGRVPKTKKSVATKATTVASTATGYVSQTTDLNAGARAGVTVSRKNEWITGAVGSKPNPVYTGTKVIGVGVLHKSCLQPIFNKEAAEDISKMRR